MKLRKELEEKILGRIADEGARIDYWFEFNKYNTYDETVIVCPLYIKTLTNDGVIVGHEEDSEYDEYALYELTDNSLIEMYELFDEWLLNGNYTSKL
jgi:hypothetical protein